MNWNDTLGVIAKLAPTIAAGLGGPLAGGAVAALESVFGITPKPDANQDARQSDLAAAISGATPQQLLDMKKAENDYALAMAQAGFKDKEELAQLKVQQELAYVTDTQDARKYKDEKVFWMGVVILLIFAIVMGSALYGCYGIIVGGIVLKDPSTIAAVAGFLGSIIGYVAANAQQVVGFFFGSSAGSESKTQAMADGFKQAITAKEDK